jgi:hypothetical protein
MLLWRVEKYLRSSGMTPTRFGRESLGDPCFVFDLRKGREPRAGTAGRVVQFTIRSGMVVSSDHSGDAGPHLVLAMQSQLPGLSVPTGLPSRQEASRKVI